MNILTEIQKWTAVSQEEINERLRLRGKLQFNFSKVLNDGFFKPSDLYCYLKARFGPPNGLIMRAKNPSADNIIHWNYTVRIENNWLDIIGIRYRVEFISKTTEIMDKSDWDAMFINIRNEFRNCGREMKQIRDSLEHWTIFINPYSRLRFIINYFIKQLKEIELDKHTFPKPMLEITDKEEYITLISTIASLYKNAISIGTSIRMLAPVLGEAAINMIIFILIKDDIRNDERRYKEFLQQQIDVRIKNIPLFCEPVIKKYSGEEVEIKNFLKVMNSRNDFLHGNVDPQLLAFDEVLFDKYIPLFAEEKSFPSLGILPLLHNVTPELAIKDVEYVDNFIEFLLNCIEQPAQQEIRMLLNDPHPGWRNDTKRLGVLFQPFEIDVVPIDKNEEVAE